MSSSHPFHPLNPNLCISHWPSFPNPFHPSFHYPTNIYGEIVKIPWKIIRRKRKKKKISRDTIHRTRCLSSPFIFLSCIHFLPLPLIHPFTFPLPLALYTGGKLHPYHFSFHLPFIIRFHLWSWLSYSFHPFILTFHIHPLSIHSTIYVHNSSIYLILTCHRYLAFRSSCHVHPFSIHTHA